MEADRTADFSHSNTLSEPVEEQVPQAQQWEEPGAVVGAEQQQKQERHGVVRTHSEKSTENATIPRDTEDSTSGTLPDHPKSIGSKEKEPTNSPSGTNGEPHVTFENRPQKRALRVDRVPSKASINENEPHSSSSPLRSASLDELERWPSSRTWRIVTPDGPDGISLPQSDASSAVSSVPGQREPLPTGQSLEQLALHPEEIALPTKTRDRKALTPSGFKQWAAGEPFSKSRIKPKELHDESLTFLASPDVLEYRACVDQLASRFSNLPNVSSTHTRHELRSRIVFYDCLDSESLRTPRRQEPWKDHAFAPFYGEFYDTLRSIPDGCTQRTICIEDLTPSLISMLGAAFKIPPYVFEEHLDRSGYIPEVADRKDRWQGSSSSQGFSSITWYRPVLPTIPISPKLRSKLIAGQHPAVKCPHGCGKKLRLGTASNIWRRYLDLSPDPGVHYKGSINEYPVAWTERATIFYRNYDDCKFVIVLLDPLPVVVHRETGQNDQTHHQGPTIKIVRLGQDKKVYSRNVKPRTQEFSLGVDIPDWIAQFPSLPSPQGSIRVQESPSQANLTVTAIVQNQRATSGQGPAGLQGNIRATGSLSELSEGDFTPATLRRRATKSRIDQAGSVREGNQNTQARTKDGQKASTEDPKGASHTQLPPTPPSPRPTLQNIQDGFGETCKHHAFVPFEPIRARPSSMAHKANAFTALQVSKYIESLQTPTSTLDEFDHIISSPTNGKIPIGDFDPMQALMRAIHYDTLSLVDVVRVSLRRVREGNEGLMQQRISFWRSLLNRLNFGIVEIDQQLRDFVLFAHELNTSTELASSVSAKETQETLRNFMDVIEKSLDSLRAEIQILDSRRSIEEAQSVAKLTELAFVFIPVSAVASVYGVQFRGLDNGVPVHQFVLIALGFVIIAYAVRLTIRSSKLIQYRNEIFEQIREEAGLQYSQSIPARTFTAWIGKALGRIMWSSSLKVVVVLLPSVIILSAVAAILSPIILLWVRRINTGFSAVITILVLLLDAILISPLFTNDSGGIRFNLKALIRDIQKNREEKRRQKDELRRRMKRQNGEFDPEWQDDSEWASDVSDEDDIGSGGYIGHG